MAEIARIASGLVNRVAMRLAELGVLAAFCISMQTASAQNLVQDPDFANGLASYPNNVNATPTTMFGITGVDLVSASSEGYAVQSPLSSSYTAGVTYIFSFLAAALDADSPTLLVASFRPNCPGGCDDTYFLQSTSNTALTRYSFTATAQQSGADSDLFVEAEGGGGAFFTGLDLEPAPAPIPGGGALSFGVLLAGTAIWGMRRRQSIKGQ